MGPPPSWVPADFVSVTCPCPTQGDAGGQPRPELAAVAGAERFLAEIKTTANLIYFEGSSVEELEAATAHRPQP